MLEIVSRDTRIDFVGRSRPLLLLSLALVLSSLLALALRGPRWGVDFTGGLLLHVRTDRAIGAAALRQAFVAGGIDVAVQDVGASAGEYLLRFTGGPPDLEEAVRHRLDAAFPSRYEVLRIELVGPRVGADLRRQALLGVLAATVMMGSYVAWRFEPRFGIGAALALLHDVVVTLGALVAAGYEIDLTIVAALLTVVGFSVNDTVIVSDRIRENRRKYPRLDLPALANRSLNETLSRTVLTTGTTLLVALALFALGGPVIHGFAFTLLVGCTVGTYSSIFVAIPVVLAFGRSRR